MKLRALVAGLLLPATCIGEPFDWNALIGPATDLVSKSTAFYSADELYRVGRGAATIGYVVGVVDADYSSLAKQGYCLPNKVTVQQVFDVTWRYLEQNPKDRHHGAPYMVRRALTDAWPCPK